MWWRRFERWFGITGASIRVAVLGCGSIGRRHLTNLRALGQPDICAFDPDSTARDIAGSRFGVPVFAALEDVWRWGPSAVLVASPSVRHVDQALEAARQGCHLFVEKPLGHSLDGVAPLQEVVRELGLITMVGCNMRFHPGPRTVKSLVDAGAIGDVLSARLETGSFLPAWRPGTDYTRSYSADLVQGGAVLDCIHEIDLALWLSGPATLAAATVRRARSIDLEVDGLAELLLTHAGGSISSVHLNFIQRDYHRTCHVIGSEGTLYWDFSLPLVVRRTGSGVDRHELPADWDVNSMYVDEMSHFLGSVKCHAPTICPLDQGASALSIALEARGALAAADHRS
jgi:predicted dehydrogenase